MAKSEAQQLMRVGHWIPSYRRQMHVLVGQNMLRDCLDATSRGWEYRHWWTDTTDIARARNEALEHAVREDFDFLMMQDSDIYCSDQTSALCRMIETAQQHDAAMVGAICGLRRIRTDSVDMNVMPYRRGEVYGADACGTGMVVIDVSMIRGISNIYDDGPWFARTYGDARQSQMGIGEDIFFCRVLKGLGLHIVVDGRVSTVHAYTDEIHLAYTGNASR